MILESMDVNWRRGLKTKDNKSGAGFILMRDGQFDI